MQVKIAFVLLGMCLLSLVHGFTEKNKDKIKELIIKAATSCVEKENVPASDIELLKGHKMPESHEGFCLFRCMYEQYNILEDGKFNRDALMETIKIIEVHEDHMDKVNKVIENCIKQVGDGDKDACLTAKAMVQCTHDHKEDLELDILALI